MTEPVWSACANPACLRKVSLASRYCCRGCGVAHDAHFDPEGYHSPGCDERAAERGEWSVYEAEANR
jgi:hypothetical protein